MSQGLPAAPSAGAARALSGGRLARLVVLVVVLAALVAFPVIFTNQLIGTIAFLTLIYVAAAVAWNIFSGYSGYLSLGHAVFFGSGAYAAGIVARDLKITGPAEFALLPVAAVAGALIAVPFGLVALRVRRHTFVVITIAIFFIFQYMGFDLKFTNGTAGLDAPFLLWDPVTFDERFYWIALATVVGSICLSWLIRGSRFGLQLRAIRDDEDRAASLGVRAMPVKLTSFVISATITALIGAIWFFFIGQVFPQSGFDPLFDLTIALMAFLGGLGTVAGPVLGALIITPAQQVLSNQFNNDYLSQILLGAIFLAVVLFLPRGLLPTVEGKVTSWRRASGRHHGAAQVAPAGGQASGRAAGPATSQASAAEQASRGTADQVTEGRPS